jgi:hypothetical protein
MAFRKYPPLGGGFSGTPFDPITPQKEAGKLGVNLKERDHPKKRIKPMGTLSNISKE